MQKMALLSLMDGKKKVIKYHPFLLKIIRIRGQSTPLVWKQVRMVRRKDWSFYLTKKLRLNPFNVNPLLVAVQVARKTLGSRTR